jgi:hypothetical protein
VRNTAMGCWEVFAQIGGFGSEKEAKRGAKALAGMLAGRRGAFTEAALAEGDGPA